MWRCECKDVSAKYFRLMEPLYLHSSSLISYYKFRERNRFVLKLQAGVAGTSLHAHLDAYVSIPFQATHVRKPFSPDFRRRGFRWSARLSRAYETSTGFLLRDILLICGGQPTDFLSLFLLDVNLSRELR